MTPETTPEAATIAPERLALYTRLAQQAAGWWGATIGGPTSLANFDNGDSSPQGGMAMALATRYSHQAAVPTAAQVARFEELVSAEVLKALLEDPHPVHRRTPKQYQQLLDDGYTAEEIASWDLDPVRKWHNLATDYGPGQGILGEAATAAGISHERFPWKTVMWVCWDARPENCYIEVRKGYGAKAERLPAVGEEVSPA